MIIVSEPMALAEIREKHNDFFPEMVKIVADLSRKKVALNAELHSDLEEALLEDGSDQKDLWGANLYFEAEPGQLIEFISLINIRPGQQNFSMELQDPILRDELAALAHSLIRR